MAVVRRAARGVQSLLLRLAAPAAVAAAALLAPAGGPAAAAPRKEEPFDIRADSGFLSEGGTEDIVTLTGHVVLRRGSTTITAESGQYMRVARTAILSGQVVVHDTTTTIEATQATYYRTEDVIVLQGAVRVRDKDLTLTGQNVTYDRKTKRAVVTGTPILTQKEQTLTADRITYARTEDRLSADGHVHGLDGKERVEVWGDHVEYDRKTKAGVLTGTPRLVSTDDDGRQTTLAAERIHFTDSPRIVTALDSVRIVRGAFHGVADTVSLFDAENRVVLTGHPEAWDAHSRVRADSLDLYLVNRRLDHARVVQGPRGPARLEYVGAPTDTTAHGRRSGRGTERVSVEAPRLDIGFRDEEVRTVDARPAATATYRYDEPVRPERTEENEVTGERIHADIGTDKIEHVVVTGAANGTYRYFPKNDPAKRDEVTYAAPEIEFKVQEDRIVLSQGAEVTHGGTTLEAPTITFNANREALGASGPITLNDNGEVITGAGLTYDLETGQGAIEGGRTTLERGFYSGKQLRKVDENTYAVENATYTTCDLPHPHYGFSARQMKIQVGKRVIAKPVVFFIGKVPVFALPFYVIPIEKDRHSGMLFPQMDFGFSQPEGRFFRNLGYYWAPSQYWDATTVLDYYEGNPFAFVPTRAHGVLRLSGRYVVRRIPLSGDAAFSYSRPDVGTLPDWTVAANHTQRLPHQVNLTGFANFASSARARTVIENDLASRLSLQSLHSGFTLARSWPGVSASLGVDRTQTLASPADTVAGLPAVPGVTYGTRPEVAISLPSRPLGIKAAPGRPARLPALSSTYFSVSTRYVDRFNTTRDSLQLARGGLNYRRLQTTVALSGAPRLGWLSLSPSVTVSDTRYGPDSVHAIGAGFDRLTAGLAASSTLYGYFLHRVGPVSGIRHVLVPSLSYAVTPGVDSAARPFADGATGYVPTSQVLSFAIDQRIQMKLGSGTSVKKLDNLVSMRTSFGYDLAHGLFTGPAGRPVISSSLRLAPLDRLTADVSWNNVAPSGSHRWGQFQDVAVSVQSNLAAGGTWSGLLSTLTGKGLSAHASLPPNTEARGFPSGEPQAESLLAGAPPIPAAATAPVHGQYPWAFSLAAGAAYSGTPGRLNGRFASGNLDLQLTPNWKVNYSMAYDFDRGSISSQQYSIYRSLHCWEARFVRQQTGLGWTYYFRIGVKDLPEIYLERGSRYIGTPHIPLGAFGQ